MIWNKTGQEQKLLFLPGLIFRKGSLGHGGPDLLSCERAAELLTKKQNGDCKYGKMAILCIPEQKDFSVIGGSNAADFMVCFRHEIGISRMGRSRCEHEKNSRMNAPLIAFFGKWIDRRFSFEPRFAKLTSMLSNP